MSSPGQVDTLFATPEWFEIWGESFYPRDYAVWRAPNGSPPAAIPYIRRTVKWSGIPVRLAYGNNFHTPRVDTLAGRCTLDDYQSMLKDIDVDCLMFYSVAEHSRVMEGLAPFRKSGNVHSEPCETSPFVDCTLGWEAYWAGRGKNLRSNIASIEKKLKDSRVESLELSTWEEIEPVTQAMYAIEASGWKGQRGTAISQDPRARRFYDRLMAEFSKRDLIRVFLLRIDGEIAAFEINTRYLGVLTGLKGGFLESYARYSPGQLLRFMFLQRAFQDPDLKFYDMLGPANETKTRWATAAETLYSVRIFRSSPRGLLCRARYVTAPRLKAQMARPSTVPSHD